MVQNIFINPIEGKELSKEKKKRNSLMLCSLQTGAPKGEDDRVLGLEDDFPLIQIIDDATLHSKIEIIQIVQTMSDYPE